MRRTSPTLALLAPTLLASCLSAVGPRSDRVLPLTQDRAEGVVENAFARLGIPIHDHFPDGRVASGPFDARQQWGEAAEERVDCGWDERGEPLSRGRSVDMQVNATIRLAGGGGSRVAVSSAGSTRTYDGKRVRCQLSTAFTRALLAEIGGAPDGGSVGVGPSR